MRAATSSCSLALPTWRTSRLLRSCSWPSSTAASHRWTIVGMTEVRVTRSRSINGKQASGWGVSAKTTRPPTRSVPMMPGQPHGKLNSTGRTAR